MPRTIAAGLEECNLIHLPDELLVKIFGLLNGRSLASLRCTCKRFLRVASDATLENELILAEEFDDPSLISSNVLSYFLENAFATKPLLDVLDLRGTQADRIWLIGLPSSNLRVLRTEQLNVHLDALAGLVNLEELWLSELHCSAGMRAPALRKLVANAAYADKIDPSQALPRLVSLTLTNDRATLFATPLMPGLRTLSLGGCVPSTDALQSALAARATPLVDLRLLGAYGRALTDSMCVALVAAAPGLEHLVVHGASSLTDAGVSVLLARLPHLRTLELLHTGASGAFLSRADAQLPPALSRIALWPIAPAAAAAATATVAAAAAAAAASTGRSGLVLDLSDKSPLDMLPFDNAAYDHAFPDTLNVFDAPRPCVNRGAGCPVLAPLGAINAHIAVCALSIVVCRQCLRPFPRAVLARHQACVHVRQERMRLCPLRTMGCLAYVASADAPADADHERRCALAARLSSEAAQAASPVVGSSASPVAGSSASRVLQANIPPVSPRACAASARAFGAFEQPPAGAAAVRAATAQAGTSAGFVRPQGALWDASAHALDALLDVHERRRLLGVPDSAALARKQWAAGLPSAFDGPPTAAQRVTSHLAHGCAKYVVVCPSCRASVARAQLLAHAAVCGGPSGVAVMLGADGALPARGAELAERFQRPLDWAAQTSGRIGVA